MKPSKRLARRIEKNHQNWIKNRPKYDGECTKILEKLEKDEETRILKKFDVFHLDFEEEICYNMATL